MKKLSILLVISLLAVSITPVLSQPEWIIDGDTVYIDDAHAYLSATPHTLTSSGWVEFELMSKQYEGNIDMVLGVVESDHIRISKPQIWKANVTHNVTEWVEGDDLEGEVTIYNITDYTPLAWAGQTPDIGNDSNAHLVELEISGNSTLLVAYNSYDEIDSTTVTFYYYYTGKELQWHLEYYADYKKLPLDFSGASYSYQGVDYWYYATLDAPVVEDTLYKVRCWIHVPIRLGAFESKYVWAIKPSSETIVEAKEAGHLYLLDPWLAGGWDYRKVLNITGQAGAGTNYQVELLVGETSGAVGEDFDLEGHCTDFPNDITFTDNDGETELDHWLEITTGGGANELAYFWTEVADDLGSNRQIYVYYGKAGQASSSNGANTFINFEDFEWGNDGDDIDTSGGSETWVLDQAVSDIDTGKYFGNSTRSLIQIDSGANPECDMQSVLHSASIAIRQRVYIPSSLNPLWAHGDGTHAITVGVEELTQDIQYYDTEWRDTGSDSAINEWVLFEFNDFDWAGATYDIWYNGGKVKDDAAMRTDARWDDEWRVYTGSDGAVWTDDVIVRKWISPEPAFSAAGSEEEAPSGPTVGTKAATNIESTTATFNGNVTATGATNVTERGFVWDTSSHGDPGDTAINETAYASYWSEVGNWTTFNFSHNVTGLSAATNYWYRAGAKNDLDHWAYGDEATFLTKPAAPGNVTASDGTYTGYTRVTWSASVGNVSGYWLYVDGTPTVDVGNVTGYNYTSGAGTITPGATAASAGVSPLHVVLAVAGESTSNGASNVYSLTAYNPTGNSTVSANDTGYRGVGSITYQWYRGAANCTGFSQIAGGTTDPYNDTASPAPTIDGGNATACDGCSGSWVTLSCNETSSNGDTRCFLCELSATGAVSQNTTTDTGYRGTDTLSYQWWRSWADVAANYTQIAGGTTDPYNDAGGAVDPDGRYYLLTTSMSGATSQNSSADRGYIANTASVTTLNATNLTCVTATLVGNITNVASGNVTTRGFDYGTSTGNYTWSTNETGNWGLGTYSLNITSLTQNTTYYYRAFVVNVVGTGYGSEVTFNTTAATLPIVTNSAATDIQTDRATLHGNITDAGCAGIYVTTRGFQWGTSTGNYSWNWTESGTFGTGAYSHIATSLTANTTYFWRALAINAVGANYSAELSFTTEAEAETPTPTTVDMTALIDYLDELFGGPMGIGNIILIGFFLVIAVWKKGWIRIVMSLAVIIWGAFAIEYDIKVGAPLLAVGTFLFVMALLRLVQERRGRKAQEVIDT